ncbi:MAG: SMP-30/gluconolactonase/LRE family protein [Gammaproteobacteria bacterium]|nr:SMP-30/gluconolactonase/LRE family protein [Gammaproteobacteria bacterium]
MMHLVLRTWICLTALVLLRCSDTPETVQPVPGTNLPRSPPGQVVAPDSEWETLGRGYVYSDAPASDAEGNVYYVAITQNRIYRISPEGQVETFDTGTAMTMGLTFGPEGRLYGCRNRDAQIVVYTIDGEREVLVQGELTPIPGRPGVPSQFCNDLAVSSTGGIWFTDRINRQVKHVDAAGKVSVVASGFRPNGITLSADGSMLAVTDSLKPKLWAFTVGEGGSLTLVEDFFDPVMMAIDLDGEAINEGRPGTNGMTVDQEGRYFVSSFFGIQVFDPQGKYIGVIDRPTKFVSNLAFGGEKCNYLYATGLNGIYRLATLTTGAHHHAHAKVPAEPVVQGDAPAETL